MNSKTCPYCHDKIMEDAFHGQGNHLIHVLRCSGKVKGNEMTEKNSMAPAPDPERELELYEMRKHSESLDPNYCGSCSYETHVAQLRSPESWVQSGKKMWEEDWEKKLLADKMKALEIPSDLIKCQLMVLALTEQLSEQTAINNLLEAEMKQQALSLLYTAKGERSADQEVDRLRKRLEVEQTCNHCGKYHGKEVCSGLQKENRMLINEMTGIDDKWYQRLRDQAQHFEVRTRLIKHQLHKMLTLAAENKLFQPPPSIIVKCGKSQVFDENPPMISVGCTWPVGNCQCMDGDQGEG